MPTAASLAEEKETEKADTVELNLRRLRRALAESRGKFFLYPVESNLSWEAREAVFTQLEDFLEDTGMHLHRIVLTREQHDLYALVKDRTFSRCDVALILGLEDTPGIAPAGGEEHKRPPALSVLNLQRESIERLLNVPTVLWCPPFAYTALIKHAPDFYDHYSATFRFLGPELLAPKNGAGSIGEIVDNGIETVRRTEKASPTLVDFYEKQILKDKINPVDRARALAGLADELWKQRIGDINAQIERGLKHIDEAISLFSEANKETEIARCQNIKGILLCNLPSGDRSLNLSKAISCYESALRVYTESDFPMQWATIQNNLGTAYCNLPSGDRSLNLSKAISCYDSALRVYTESDFPMDWAMTQNNLGSAYCNLPSGDLSLNLSKAISCYDYALRVCTGSGVPMDWAMTQNNLGVAYCDLPSGDRSLNLSKAISCYESALRVRTESDFPMGWAKTQGNIALIDREQGRIQEGRERLEKAKATFERIGDEFHREEAEEILQSWDVS
jgi:tetratricopeptide (TPR) repeat protein